MKLALTAIICSHNPRPDYLDQTLAALQRQEPVGEGGWELIVVDNASHTPIQSMVDLSWHPHARVVSEERLGLSFARFRGFREANADLVVYIDDDNVLAPDYLRCAITAMVADPTLGAVGGKSIPRYETRPPAWFGALDLDLACRDLGDVARFASWSGVEESLREYPACAPIGAGMVIRRSAQAAYVAMAETDAERSNLGRKGSDLASGEDNDMIMTLLSLGWRVAYLPELRLEHLIPAKRLTRAYLANYARSGNKTWVQVLDIHGIRPWRPASRWSLPLRKARLYFTLGAWRDTPGYVRWCGACGMLDGRARLARTIAL